MLAASLTVSECTDAVAYFGHPGGLEMCHRHHQRLRPRAPVKVKLWGTVQYVVPASPEEELIPLSVGWEVTHASQGESVGQIQQSIRHLCITAQLHPNDLSVHEAVVWA